MIRAGELRHLVRLERKSTGEDSVDQFGAPVDAWTIEGRARAAIRPLGVMERPEAQRMYGECTHLVRLRGRHLKPAPAKRFIIEDPSRAAGEPERVLEIVGVMDWDEEGVELRVMCREAQ